MLGLISISYKNCSLEKRETFHYENNDFKDFFVKYNEHNDLDGVFMLSTCNRTEFLFEKIDSEISIKQLEDIFKEICIDKKVSFDTNDLVKFETSADKICKYFFRIACGIESMVIGEFQIVDQIKRSHRFFRKNKLIPTVLNRLVQKSLEISKYVRSNTNIGIGSVSVSSTAIDELGNSTDIKKKSVICVGAGPTSKISLKHLKSKQFQNIFICNRTNSKSKAIAEDLDIKYVPYKDLKNKLLQTDIVIFSTSSKVPLISEKEISQISSFRSSDLLIIDLSVPRNVVIKETYSNISIFDMDSVENKVKNNYVLRKNEIKKVKIIIDEFFEEFRTWIDERKLTSSIVFIKENILTKPNNSNTSNFNISNHLIKKIKTVTNNGKNTKALEIVNKIFE